LSIGELADRTGMTVAALRNWEARYGVPAPQRTDGGQRRYKESDCELIREVLRLRRSGLSLPAAIAQARQVAGPAERSIFAGVRRRLPGLRVLPLPKKVLLALTWAVEDHAASLAEAPVLIGAFQKQDFYTRARSRWENLASTAAQAVVFADFDPQPREARPLKVSLPADSPMRREWALICDKVEAPACVLGWEPPGQQDRPDRERVFETIWSADPEVVRTAARLGASVAKGLDPEIGSALGMHLEGSVPPASCDLARATGLLERTLEYCAAAWGRPLNAQRAHLSELAN